MKVATLFRIMLSGFRLTAQGMLLCPWIAVALVGAACASAVGLARRALGLKRALTDDVRCRRRHRVELRGEWECRGCGGLFAGWAFQRCPICGTECGHVPCDRCGLGVQNPLVLRPRLGRGGLGRQLAGVFVSGTTTW